MDSFYVMRFPPRKLPVSGNFSGTEWPSTVGVLRYQLSLLRIFRVVEEIGAREQQLGIVADACVGS